MFKLYRLTLNAISVRDTSGQALFRDTIRTQYRRADCIMFVCDVTRPETLQQLLPYVEDAKVTKNAVIKLDYTGVNFR